MKITRTLVPILSCIETMSRTTKSRLCDTYYALTTFEYHQIIGKGTEEIKIWEHERRHNIGILEELSRNRTVIIVNSDRSFLPDITFRISFMVLTGFHSSGGVICGVRRTSGTFLA